MTIGILHPDSGNITSLCDALERIGRPFRLLRRPELNGIERLILPGQGRFGAVMQYLNTNGWSEALADWKRARRPLLGICVGMQVLFESSEEDPRVPGLGLFAGRITRLQAPKHPMIGWAEVRWHKTGHEDGAAYFVNSYGLSAHPLCRATTVYGQPFCAAVGLDNWLAVQFHPEKSGTWGKEFLRQCLVC